MDQTTTQAALAGVREWFDSPAQSAHYATPAAGEVADWEVAVLNHLPVGRVLDVGAGQGRLSRWLADHGHQVDATEVSVAMAVLADQLGTDQVAYHLLHDPLTLPFGKETFDGVVVSNTLCYLPGGELRIRFIRDQVARVLKPGGVAVLANHVVPTGVNRQAEIEIDQLYRPWRSRRSWVEPGDTHCGGGGYVHWFTRASLRAEIGAGQVFTVTADGLSPDGRHAWFVAGKTPTRGAGAQ